MKIPGLTPTRKKKIVDLLKKNDWEPECLRKLGFKRRDPNGEGCCCFELWVHRQWKLIVKESYFTRKKPVKAAIPTLKLRDRKTYCTEGCCEDLTGTLVIQPLADPNISKYTGGDNHEDNMAYWNGRLVMIDW